MLGLDYNIAVSILRTYTTGLYHTWKSTLDNKSMKLFLGEKCYVDLPDGDRLCLLINYPEQKDLSKELIIAIHGLAGAATDPSVVSVAEKFLSEGHVVVRMNLRGSGHGAGLARNIYHAGRDDDMAQVVEAVSVLFPEYKISMVAMSLSSNMMFRYLAKNPENIIQRAIAMSPVVDLPMASRKLSHAYFGMINKSVLSMLKSYFVKRKRAFADTTVPDWTKIKKFYHFDRDFVAPQFGFENVNDYYKSATAIPFIPEIRTPWKAVISLDDPIAVSEKHLFKKNFSRNTIILPSGGHLYFKNFGGLGEVAYNTFDKMR
jgi:predicted alpha/beta-fold hydrolase